jgi:S1-C subfamily serine protease
VNWSPRRSALSLGVVAALLCTAQASATQEPVAERALESVVTIVAGGSQGAGFAYGGPGTLITNAHVLRGARTVDVTTNAGRHVRGTVRAVDSNADLAIVEVNLELPVLQSRDELPKAGEDVYAIGSPLGLTGSVAKGIVSAVRETAIQTDVPVNPGNSGGPLLDARGRVLGVNTSKSARAEGIAFAVMIGAADALLKRPAGPPAARESDPAVPLSVLFVSAGLVLVVAVAVLAAIRRRRHRENLGIRLRRGRRKPNPVGQWEPDDRVVIHRTER